MCDKLLIASAALLALLTATSAQAQVVTLGASLTEGLGLSRQDSYPVQMEALLHKRGINVTVTNQGISGDTNEGMLNRLDSAVPNGTRVVVFNATQNDAKKYANHGRVLDTDGDIRKIVERLRSRGIAVVMTGNPHFLAIGVGAGAISCGELQEGVSPDARYAPGHHPDAAAYAIIARHMASCVMRVLSSSR